MDKFIVYIFVALEFVPPATDSYPDYIYLEGDTHFRSDNQGTKITVISDDEINVWIHEELIILLPEPEPIQKGKSLWINSVATLLYGDYEFSIGRVKKTLLYDRRLLPHNYS